MNAETVITITDPASGRIESECTWADFCEHNDADTCAELERQFATGQGWALAGMFHVELLDSPEDDTVRGRLSTTTPMSVAAVRERQWSDAVTVGAELSDKLATANARIEELEGALRRIANGLDHVHGRGACVIACRIARKALGEAQ